MKRKRLFLVVLALAFLAVALEVSLRHLFPQRPLRAVPHEKYGWMMNEYGAYGQRNAHGFRDHAWPEHPDVLIVGDSFAMGDEVRNLDMRFDAFLEIPSANASVAGWGLEQYILCAEDLIPQLRPKAIVFVFCGNDCDTARRWVTTAKRVASADPENVLRKSALYLFLRHRFVLMRTALVNAKDTGVIDPQTGERMGPDDYSRATDLLNGFLMETDIPVILVPTNPMFEPTTAWMRHMSKHDQVSWLQWGGEFDAIEETYLPHDRHWNESAHQSVGKALNAALLTLLAADR